MGVLLVTGGSLGAVVGGPFAPVYAYPAPAYAYPAPAYVAPPVYTAPPPPSPTTWYYCRSLGACYSPARSSPHGLVCRGRPIRQPGPSGCPGGSGPCKGHRAPSGTPTLLHGRSRPEGAPASYKAGVSEAGTGSGRGPTDPRREASKGPGVSGSAWRRPGSGDRP